MVVQRSSVTDQRSGNAASQSPTATITNSAIQETSATTQDTPARVSLVGTIIRARGLSATAGKILLASWKPATIRQYDTQLAKWQQFCATTNDDPYSVSENALMNFLATLKDKNLKKSTIATAKAAVLNLWLLSDGVKLESHVLSLFMRGISQLEPVRTKARGIWDPSIVLEMYQNMPENWDLSLLQLTKKCVMLIALATAQRVQTLRALDVWNITVTTTAVAFVIDTRLKQTLGDRETPLLYLPRIKEGKTCVWNCVMTYILRTRKLRKVGDLFIISKPPHTPATSTTISRWLREVLQQAGINIALYKAHSTRAAASSKASKFVPIHKVLEAADWRGKTVFEKHYCREVSGRGDFADAVWQQ